MKIQGEKGDLEDLLKENELIIMMFSVTSIYFANI